MEIDTIIQPVIKRLNERLDLKAQWIDGGPLDGQLVIPMDNYDMRFVVEVKRQIRQHTIQQLLHLKHVYRDFILFAEVIYPKQKRQLQEKGILYADAMGNINLKKGLLWILIDTPNKIEARVQTGNRAFTTTGLKVLFQFLLNKELVNQPQRVIAHEADVGLGNIPQVLKGLKNTGYLLDLTKGQFIWENRKRLLDRWATEYEAKLIPKLHKGRYELKGFWKDLRLNPETMAWGGEAAGELLTDYLRAEHLVLYTYENRTTLLNELKLRPHKKGNVEVRTMFWTKRDKKEIVPPVLAYVDLVLSNNQRCLDSAEMVFNKYLKNEL